MKASTALAVALGTASVLAAMLSFSLASQARPKYRPIATAAQFKGYRQWARVNPKPLYLDLVTASLCRLPSAKEVKDAQANPHRRVFFTVYVNAIGRNAMLYQAKPVFPVGSMIVKEKLLSLTSHSPELLTAMVKRAKDFDPGNGDWEYVVLNGAASKVEGQGKLANCRSCHAGQKGMDYVFRTYLPVGKPAAFKK